MGGCECLCMSMCVSMCVRVSMNMREYVYVNRYVLVCV